jgi:hypothetical protein
VAERRFGWGRLTVDKGTRERESGVRCLENFRARGRRRAKDANRKLADDIRSIVEPKRDADPELKSSRRYCTLSAGELREALRAGTSYAVLIANATGASPWNLSRFLSQFTLAPGSTPDAAGNRAFIRRAGEPLPRVAAASADRGRPVNPGLGESAATAHVTRPERSTACFMGRTGSARL